MGPRGCPYLSGVDPVWLRCGSAEGSLRLLQLRCVQAVRFVQQAMRDKLLGRRGGRLVPFHTSEEDVSLRNLAIFTQADTDTDTHTHTHRAPERLWEHFGPFGAPRDLLAMGIFSPFGAPRAL